MMSLVIPGLGQLYAGRSTRGAVIMVVSVILLFGFGTANIAAAIDAYLLAAREREAMVAQSVGARGRAA